MHPISVVVPVFNGQGRLPKMLSTLRSQEYDQSLVDLIVADDDSTDSSVAVAMSYGARIVRNGTKNPERGKSLGIEAAKHDLLLFLDDDNYLPHSAWLGRLVRSYCIHPTAVGAQCAWFVYNRRDAAVNRYCCLFGCPDPLVYYLGLQDHLRRIDARWGLCGTVKSETGDHWVVRFSDHGFPTIGSQGFLTRKSFVCRATWQPYYFHIDSNYELARQGCADFVILKESVGHDFAPSVGRILSKLRRNIRQFTRDRSVRPYRYETNVARIALAFAQMLTLVGPLAAAIKTYAKTKDAASWLHPYVSFRVALLYLLLGPWYIARNWVARRIGRKLGTLQP
ncbi:MAG: glycosyltransferase family 2 protein [Candidatus Tyrphobacter sp.]